MEDDKSLDFQQMQNNAISHTVQDNVADSSIMQNGVTELTQTNLVTFPNTVESIAVEKRHIRKIRSLCEGVKSPSIPLAEMCLGAASLFAGALLSAIISEIPFQLGFKSVLFYIISPSIAASCFVAYLFLRKNEGASAKNLADHILEYLPDEDKSEGTNL